MTKEKIETPETVADSNATENQETPSEEILAAIKKATERVASTQADLKAHTLVVKAATDPLARSWLTLVAFGSQWQAAEIALAKVKGEEWIRPTSGALTNTILGFLSIEKEESGSDVAAKDAAAQDANTILASQIRQAAPAMLLCAVGKVPLFWYLKTNTSTKAGGVSILDVDPTTVTVLNDDEPPRMVAHLCDLEPRYEVSNGVWEDRDSTEWRAITQKNIGDSFRHYYPTASGATKPKTSAVSFAQAVKGIETAINGTGNKAPTLDMRRDFQTISSQISTTDHTESFGGNVETVTRMFKIVARVCRDHIPTNYFLDTQFITAFADAAIQMDQVEKMGKESRKASTPDEVLARVKTEIRKKAAA